jgi:hypothetical protein
MAAIFVASGQGLMEVRIPSQNAHPAAIMNSFIITPFLNDIISIEDYRDAVFLSSR